LNERFFIVSFLKVNEFRYTKRITTLNRDLNRFKNY
jgi:hypothetical protein